MPVETRLQRKIKNQQQTQQPTAAPQPAATRRVTRSMAAQMDTSGLTPQDVLDMQGTAGNQAVSQMLAGDSSSGQPARDATSAPGGFHAGQHGFKKEEQQRLSAAHGITVTGQSHESEHTVGNEVLIRSSGLKRKQNARARQIEDQAPAYQEVKQFHRKHIGTGTHSEADASGFNSKGYRDSQRSLIEAGDVSSAVQLNQLGYAFDPKFQGERDKPESKAASDSYNTMVTNMDSLTFAKGKKNTSVQVDPIQKAEMILARKAAQTGQWPTAEEIRAVKKSLNIKEDSGKDDA